MSASVGADLVIRPMRPEEYERWLPLSRAGYAQDMIENGGVDPEVAARKADADFAVLLTEGIDTPGHVLCVLEAEGEPVGDVWLAERDEQIGRSLWVFDLRVDEAQRGRGFGKRAMAFAEEEARRRGLPVVALNVFGGNTVARGLYRSLGYSEDAIHMSKRV